MNEEAIRKAFIRMAMSENWASLDECWAAWQAATRAAAPAWRDIESAPRDVELLVGRFVNDEWRTCESCYFFDPGNEMEGEPACWCWSCDWDNGGVTDHEGPSHWMHKPAAPEAKP